MLAAATLLTELQRFADPDAGVFAGWPLGKPDARQRWAHAFAVYIANMVDTAPVLTPTGTTLVFSGVEAAFFASLTLENPTIAAAALDFADAWKAGITALLPGAPATNPSTVSYTFATMDPMLVTTRWTALQAALVAAFTSRQMSRRDDLSEIADAFHAATVGLMSTLSPYVVTYG